MIGREVERQINRLLQDVERDQTPLATDLGTPRITENAPVRELISLGPGTVDYLLELARTSTPKVAAYIVLVAGTIGTGATVAPLGRLCSNYEARPNKSDWDYAVIGQCNASIQALKDRFGS